ncbi:zinc finger (ubiquitin-hydrolase) domain-containing protein [Zea mays]|uniref:Zinc finger (Ubiquitin-hydrolase) domain-containing protein n=1 Tax=Zea mays TaxID=4577 RepID=A0A1D6DW80_MAIZE|nr:zinc finger (ubiquitin-hydrolase) domain-containing protein [Zea mays]
MFVLRIQSVDFPDAAVAAVAADEVGTSSGGVTTSRPLSSHPPPSTTTSSILTLELPGANPVAPSRSPRILHTRGVIHLYHSSSSTSTSSSYASAVAATSSSSSGPATPQPASDSHLPLCRGTRLLVLAVPTRVSPEDFVRFCGPHLECAADIRFIRDDGVEDRYSVLVEFEDQSSAEWFYADLNGWRFSTSESEVCHVLFIAAVQYTPSSELFAFQVCQFCQKQSENSTCSVCQTTGNLWICVICGFVGCGRYQEGHAKQHWKDTQHCYSLDLETQRVWDYVGDSFVHRLNQSKSDAKHAKFKSKSKYSGDECVNCSCNDDSDMGGAMFSSKAETIVDEYNRLLASQLETQREYYEGLLSEAKRNKEHQISEAADKAVSDKLEEMQLKLENLIVEKKKVADMNEKLTRSQDMWRQTLRDIEERERAQLKSKDEMILDLEEQIKDFKFSIKLQKSIEKNDGVKGGTLVPLPTVSDSGGKGKRSSRTSKRRN